jgi:hypothetical protein
VSDLLRIIKPQFVKKQLINIGFVPFKHPELHVHLIQSILAMSPVADEEGVISHNPSE